MSEKRILIIDDEETIKKAIKKALKNEGYKLQFASDGQEGLNKIKKDTPDLIFLDLRMPVMDGVEFLKKIKIKHDDQYFVVVITGHGDDKDIDQCYDFGVNNFLRKPVSMTEICALTKRCLKAKEVEAELADYRENLETLVDKQIKKIKEKSEALTQANMSLRILIKQLSDAQQEERVGGMPNLKELVLPSKDQLESILSSPTERAYIDNIMLNLNRVTSSFSKKLSQKDWGLSPKEIQVADLIRVGLSNKESALQMNVTKSTIEFHRDNLRKKLGLKHEKKNLRAYLMALDATMSEE